MREIVILRVGWLLAAPYEWSQHVRIGRKLGLADTDFAAVAAGPENARWSAAEARLLSFQPGDDIGQ